MLGILYAQRSQGFPNCGRVMAEIVEHRTPSSNPAYFHAPLDSFERIERGLDLVVLQSAMFGTGHNRQRVAHIQFPKKGGVKLEARDFELRRRRSVTNIESLHSIPFVQAEALNRAVSHIEQWCEILVIAISQQEAIPRNQADEMFK